MQNEYLESTDQNINNNDEYKFIMEKVFQTDELLDTIKNKSPKFGGEKSTTRSDPKVI